MMTDQEVSEDTEAIEESKAYGFGLFVQTLKEMIAEEVRRQLDEREGAKVKNTI